MPLPLILESDAFHCPSMLMFPGSLESSPQAVTSTSSAMNRHMDHLSRLGVSSEFALLGNKRPTSAPVTAPAAPSRSPVLTVDAPPFLAAASLVELTALARRVPP